MRGMPQPEKPTGIEGNQRHNTEGTLTDICAERGCGNDDQD